MIGQKGLPAKFGGVERHVHDLSTILVERGFQVSAYSRPWYAKKSKPSQIDGVDLVYLPSLHSKHLDTISHTFLATLHAIKSNVDVIHYHGVGPSLWSFIPKIFSPRTKVIATFHSIDRKHEKWGLFAKLVLLLGEWATCKIPDQTISVSNTIKQYVRDVYDCEAIYIPNAVPNYKRTKDTSYIKKWDLTTNSYVVMISRLIPHKGAHYLVEAYNSLTKTNPKLAEKNKLVIVGGGHYTDNYVEKLRKMAKKNPNIIFTGFQTDSELRQLYSHAKLFVHPSDKEGMPISVLEAMSYGLPTLLSDIPEHIEFVKNSEYLFSHGQSKSLKDQLVKLLQKKNIELKEHGKTNKQLIESEYQWDNIIDKTIDVYHIPKGKVEVKIVNA